MMAPQTDPPESSRPSTAVSSPRDRDDSPNGRATAEAVGTVADRDSRTPTSGTPAAADATPGTSRGTRRPGSLGLAGSILSLLVLIAFSLVTVSVTAVSDRKLSQIDESAHIDSVFRAPDIVRTGEKMLPETLGEISCRGGLEGMDFVPPPCGTYQAEPAEGYPVGGGGYNTADIHPPLYYDITKLAITVAGWFTDADPVTLMRLTGGFWLALGACLTWLLARRLGANRWAAFGVAAFMAAGFSVQEMSAIVNVDALVLPTGAAFALLALSVWRLRAVWWVLALATVVVMLVKMTNLAGLAVVCVFFVIREATRPLPNDVGPGLQSPSLGRWWSANGAGVLRALGVGVLVAAAAGITTLAWTAIKTARQLVPGDSLPIAEWFHIDHLGLDQVGAQIFSFVAPTEFMPRGQVVGAVESEIVKVVALGVIVGLTVAAWFRDRRAFAALSASLTCLIVMPAAYVLMNYLLSGQFFTPWFRYGFSMMPFAFASIAAGVRHRATGIAAAAIGVVAMTSALVAL